MEIIIGLTIPFLGTALGAAIVFMLRNGISDNINKAMLGFASGVMVAASFWSLLQPALEQAGDGIGNTWPVLAGFAVGMCFLLLLDTVIPHQHIDEQRPEGPHSRLPRSIKMILAVALHNIPEGMAVGLAFALAADGESFAAACALSLGIGVQNLPEGAAVSLPLRQFGLSRGRAFAVGLLSAAVEPLFGIGAVLIAGLVHPLMPWFLSFAAGAMLYVTAHELLPEARGGLGSFSFIGGFALMMVLDVALG